MALIIQQCAIVIQTTPLRQPVVFEVYNPLAVEQVTLRLESPPPSVTVDILNQTWEQQDHVSTLVHDGSPAKVTVHLARKPMVARLGSRVVPAQTLHSFGKIDVRLLKDRGPLKRRLLPD